MTKEVGGILSVNGRRDRTAGFGDVEDSLINKIRTELWGGDEQTGVGSARG